jgi:hypothetical protein
MEPTVPSKVRVFGCALGTLPRALAPKFEEVSEEMVRVLLTRLCGVFVGVRRKQETQDDQPWL